jgi:hypothetical protein
MITVQRARQFPVRPAVLVACLLLVAATPAWAAEHCVGSVSELQAALNEAADPANDESTTTVHLKQGTYHIGTTSLAGNQVHEFNALLLLGGYNSDCSARTVNPDNTVFDADGAGIVHIDPLHDLWVEGIAFRNVGAPFNEVLVIPADDDVIVRIRDNAFIGTKADVYGANVSGTHLRFVNNRVSGMPADGYSAVEILGVDSARVIGNTISGNASDHGLLVCTSSGVQLIDNIGWNNNGDDFRVIDDCSNGDNEPGDALFKYNVYQDVTLHEVAGSGNNLADTDPLFVNAATGNFRLQAASPAVNSGVADSYMADVDLDGHARVIGSAVDRGAYEAQVDDTIPATRTVTNTNDSGAGSLRQAILDANANPDYSFITFDIPGGCPQVISLASALPSITQGVRIDAWSQPGSHSNTSTTGDNALRCVILQGNGAIATGLDFAGSASTQFWLQGIAIGGFTGSGLRLGGGTDDLVWGNQFGGKVGATNVPGNGTGIALTMVATSASIGGDAPVQRNVVAGSSGNGVSIGSISFFSSTGNEIVNNLIGTYGSETVAAGNGTGIRITTSGNIVRDNVIVNSASDGVMLSGAGANGNAIEHNRIGRTDRLCISIPVPHCFSDLAPNQRHGLRLENDAHDNVVSANSVWNSGNMGISLGGSGKGNRLSANSVYASAFYGIDLDGSGLNDNDADANAANLPNRGLNYPTITRVYGGNRTGWVEGSLDSIADSYLIQVFTSAAADNEPNGEGEVYLRSGIASIFSAPAGQNGHATFRIALKSPNVALDGRHVALTAIDSTGNTSEFSFSASYLCDVIFRNGADDAEGDACAQ